MLKLSDLAARGDFEAGPLRVSPARRLVEGPAGSANVEPIVMKVFLLLLDAAGEVVTRDELFGNAWGGAFVGDDSLNRAIARVRKIANETAPGLFEIETIPRTGYRITGPIVEQISPADAPSKDEEKVSRRTVIGASATALVALAGGGLWWKQTKDERRFEKFLKLGREGMELGDGSDEPIKFLRQAAAIRPDNAEAQGLYAYALVGDADNVYRGSPGPAMEEAEAAAQASLRANPKEPMALLALMQLQRSTLDLASTEDRIRSALAASPQNVFAMQFMWNLMQSTGQSRAALSLVQQSIALKPFAAINHYPLAQLLWINGRTAEADRIIDRAMIAWPTHRYVRFARFTILAFTGRPRAALAMLESPETRPQNFAEDSITLWRKALPVLDHPSSLAIAGIREAYSEAVKTRPGLANQAVMCLSALGDVDAAFEFANRFLLFRAPREESSKSGGSTLQKSTAWRFTPWLFIPPVAPMRADARFRELCDGVGLTDYWRLRGIKPDYPIGTS